MTGQDPEPRTRDRRETSERLVRAVGRVLDIDGFPGLGVNAVAKAAGVNKVLIYRYFGGFPQLLRAYAELDELWPTDDEVAADRGALLRLDPGPRWAEMVGRVIDGVRARPLTIEVLAWEMVEQNELTRALSDVREAQFHRLMAALGHDVDPDSELVVTIATSVAASNYLAARARSIQSFAGINLHTDEGWDRIRRSLMARVAHASPSMVASGEERDEHQW